MARPSKKSIQRSINGRKIALKRFDTASQPTQPHAEELRVVEVRLSQSKIDNALKHLCFRPEADKRLKYTTRPDGPERSIRIFKAKFRNVHASIKPLAAFNFTKTEVLIVCFVVTELNSSTSCAAEVLVFQRGNSSSQIPKGDERAILESTTALGGSHKETPDTDTDAITAQKAVFTWRDAVLFASI
ncbi:hypothetical protein V1506DRAFT_510158 [Lipomyces tetrasporus]